KRDGGLISLFALAHEAIADVVFATVAVLIPTPMEERDEARAAFKEAAGKEAIIGERNFARLDAIKIFDVLWFLRNVHQLGNARLHAVGELILRDARESFGIAHLLELHFI